MKDKIYSTAVQLAKDIGVINMSKARLCLALDVTTGRFNQLAGESYTSLMERVVREVPPSDHPVRRPRAHKFLRHEAILNAAIDAALKYGYRTMSWGNVAKGAHVSRGLVVHYFKDKQGLQDAVMNAAIQRKIPAIVLQGLTMSDPLALNAPDDLKANALSPVSG